MPLAQPGIGAHRAESGTENIETGNRSLERRRRAGKEPAHTAFHSVTRRHVSLHYPPMKLASKLVLRIFASRLATLNYAHFVAMTLPGGDGGEGKHTQAQPDGSLP
jgi:hypothetical protein